MPKKGTFSFFRELKRSAYSPFNVKINLSLNTDFMAGNPDDMLMPLMIIVALILGAIFLGIIFRAIF